MPSIADKPAVIETEDIRARPIFTIAAVILVLLLAFLIGGFWFAGHFPASQATSSFSQVDQAATQNIPPLGPFTQEQLAQYRANKEALLSSYGWKDAQSGVVHIPLEHAMDLIVERGLPTWGSSNSLKTPSDMQREHGAEPQTQKSP